MCAQPRDNTPKCQESLWASAKKAHGRAWPGGRGRGRQQLMLKSPNLKRLSLLCGEAATRHRWAPGTTWSSLSLAVLPEFTMKARRGWVLMTGMFIWVSCSHCPLFSCNTITTLTPTGQPPSEMMAFPSATPKTHKVPSWALVDSKNQGDNVLREHLVGVLPLHGRDRCTC